MARLTKLRTMLSADDLDATVAFYRDRLGFTCIGTWGQDPAEPTWCQVARDDVALMFTLNVPHDHGDGEGMHSDDPALSGSIYLNVDDVDALWAEVEPRLDGFEWEPTDFPHAMREFGITDPNGYLLIFGQDIPQE
ncbi:MAG TPA: VOC family protein [Acidimicrobiales bacterium]|nr:VOC family protein [Acidimicrobiales bacterium]